MTQSHSADHTPFETNPSDHNTLANDPTPNGGFRKTGFLWAFFICVLLVSVAFAGYVLIENSEQDAMQRWQDRLSLVADSRSGEASSWLSRHLAEVTSLSNDASLQVYGSFLMAGETDTAEAQRGFIYSLLSATSERGGFHETSSLDNIAANIDRPRRAGLGFVRADGGLLVASAGFPQSLQPHLKDLPLTPAIRLGPMITDDKENRLPLVIFSAPLRPADGIDFSGQGTDTQSRPNTDGPNTGPATDQAVGWVVGVRPLGGGFYDTLIQPGNLSETTDTYVIARDEATNTEETLWRLITPLKSGGRLGDPLPDTGLRQAASRPGAVSDGEDYKGQKLLVTAREFGAPVDWRLIHQISRKEALADVNSRRNSLILSLTLAGLVVVTSLIIAWRAGTSRRLKQAYAHQTQLLENNRSLNHFLASVSNNQPAALVALTGDNKVCFANEQMAALTGYTVSDLLGRRFENLFSFEIASRISVGIRKAAETGQDEELIFLPAAQTPQKETSGKEAERNGTHKQRALKTVFLPLPAHQIEQTIAPASADLTRGGAFQAPANTVKQTAETLVVMEDVTDLLLAKVESESLLKQLIATLTRIIDARDPWSRYHSSRVMDVASSIAQELGLSGAQLETIQIAGQLVNLGKIFVPAHILTKTSPLSEDELALVRSSMARGAQLVNDLNFRGPVGLTLSQLQANWDGKGHPEGLKGDEILIESRVLRAANTFVGMVSARAHRQGLDFDAALGALFAQAGKEFDRAVIAALANALENRNGKQKWAHFTKPPKDDSEAAS